MPIMQKAQMLKKITNLEAPKDKGKSPQFSLFNNPAFISVASKIGVILDSADPISKNVDGNIHLSNTGIAVGNTSDCSSPIATIHNRFSVDGEVRNNDNSDVWTRVCKNRRGKHPRTAITP